MWLEEIHLGNVGQSKWSRLAGWLGGILFLAYGCTQATQVEVL